MAYTLAELTAFRDAVSDSYLKALKAYSYSVNSGGAGRSLTNQNLDKLKTELQYWNDLIDEYNGSSKRVKFINTPY